MLIFNLGDPLVDEDLLGHCKKGDSRGTAKFYLRPSRQHHKSAPDILKTSSSATANHKAMHVPIPVSQSASTWRQPGTQLRINTGFAGGHKLTEVTQREDQQREEERRKSSETDQQAFKVLQKPRPHVDFNQGRDSPFESTATTSISDTRALTALRKPPPPPEGRQSSISRRQSTFIQPDRKDSLPQTAARRPSMTPSEHGTSRASELKRSANMISISPHTIAPVSSDSQFSPWKPGYEYPRVAKTYNVPRKSLPNGDIAKKSFEELRRSDSAPDDIPPPSPSSRGTDDSLKQQEGNVAPKQRLQDEDPLVKYGAVINRKESFVENNISFDDAPFPSFDDDDDGSSDDDGGLWALKPPSSVTSPVINTFSSDRSMPTQLLADSLTGSTDSSTQSFNSKTKRPVLHVQITEAGADAASARRAEPSVNEMSAITERTESMSTDNLSAKEATSATSATTPTSALGELPTASDFGNSRMNKRSPNLLRSTEDNAGSPDLYKNLAASSGGDGWAVRPPAEVVYQNLEKYFPNTDLDKPIIDDTPLYSPNSPLLETSVTSASPSTPLTTTTASSSATKHNSSETKTGEIKNASPDSVPRVLLEDNPTAVRGGANIDRTFSFKSSTCDGEAVEKLDVEPTIVAAAAAAVAAASAPKLPSQHLLPGGAAVKTSRPIGRSPRMKSIRIVAKEANDARRSHSKGVDSTSLGDSKILRRKSTKMWGQKVVEVTPGQIKKGHLSIRGRGRNRMYFFFCATNALYMC